MINIKKCSACVHNPRSRFFPDIGVCKHPDFEDNKHCPIEEKDQYDIGYKAGVIAGIKGTKTALTTLLYDVVDKPANELVQIILEYAEAL